MDRPPHPRSLTSVRSAPTGDAGQPAGPPVLADVVPLRRPGVVIPLPRRGQDDLEPEPAA